MTKFQNKTFSYIVPKLSCDEVSRRHTKTLCTSDFLALLVLALVLCNVMYLIAAVLVIVRQKICYLPRLSTAVG